MTGAGIALFFGMSVSRSEAAFNIDFAVNFKDGCRTILALSMIVFLTQMPVSFAKAEPPGLLCNKVFEKDSQPPLGPINRVGGFDPEIGLLDRTRLQLELYSYFRNSIEPSKFEIRRGVQGYFCMLSLSTWVGSNLYKPEDSLINSLSKLTSQSHVIDLGAGQFRFIEEMLGERSVQDFSQRNDQSRWGDIEQLIANRKRRGLPNFTGVTLSNLPESRLNYSEEYTKHEVNLPSLADVNANPKINPLIGRYFESIPNNDIIRRFGKADLIVDLYGVFNYSANLGGVIEKVASVMKAGGEIWIYSESGIIESNGQAISLAKFMEKTGLFSIISEYESLSKTMISHLKRTDAPVHKTPLLIKSFKKPNEVVGGSPQFRWTDP